MDMLRQYAPDAPALTPTTAQTATTADPASRNYTFSDGNTLKVSPIAEGNKAMPTQPTPQQLEMLLKEQAKTNTPPGAPPVAGPAGPRPTGNGALNTKTMTAQEAQDAAAEISGTNARKLLENTEEYRLAAQQANDQIDEKYKTGIKALPEAYTEYKKLLDKEKTDAETDKNKSAGMAIFEAGLAMMSGTSRHAFENIGKGAAVGVASYKDALKDFKKAERERNKAYGDIENARLSYQRDDLKTATSLQERGADRLAKADEKSIDATAKIFDVSTQTASGIYRLSIEQAEANKRVLIQEQGANTRAAQNNPLALYEKLGGAKPDSALRKGYDIAKTEGQISGLYTEYQKLAADPMKGEDFLRRFPTAQAYISEYQKLLSSSGGNAGFVQPPANAAILKPPGQR
jgi:hypothetical protein